MYSSDDSIAVDQANEYAYWVSLASHSNHPMRVLAGDFNLTPTQRPSPFWGSSSVYTRPVINLTYSAEDPQSTYDYLHVRDPQLTIVDSANKSCAWSYSDHCYIWASYR
jgi:hypothetical protein